MGNSDSNNDEIACVPDAVFRASAHHLPNESNPGQQILYSSPSSNPVQHF